MRGWRCAEGGCVPARAGFTGGFGDAWTVADDVAVPRETTCLEEFVPRSSTDLYVARGTEFAAWDLVRREWRAETPPAARFTPGCSLALYGGGIFHLSGESLFFFQPPTHEWRGGVDLGLLGASGMTISDGDSLWAANFRDLLRSSPATSDVDHILRREPLSSARVTHDARTGRVLFASLASTELWSYAPLSRSFRFEAEAPAPIGMAFCSDHDGHVYLGSSSEPHRLWQYDTTRATWTELPSLPSETTATTNCGVWERGALYVITQPGHVLRELTLDRR